MTLTSKDHFIRKAAGYNHQQLNYHKEILDYLCLGTINVAGATYVLLNSSNEPYQTAAIVSGCIGLLGCLALAAITSNDQKVNSNNLNQESDYRVYTKKFKPYIEV